MKKIMVAAAVLAAVTGVSFAAGKTYKFDFGSAGAAAGWTAVSAKDAYSKDKGYGFARPDAVSDVAASGQNELADAVQFTADTNKTDSTNTFNVDLDPGLYQITVCSGDMFRESISAEGFYQLMNLTGNACSDTFQLPVTDGQLNILAMEGKPGTPFTLSSLVIEKISDSATMAPTIWICGDSTTSTYYPASNKQYGWGQVMDKYVNKKWQIRNLATGGQYARGFYTSGQHATVMNYIKPGDYYLIAIGINDQNYSNEAEYYLTVTKMVKETIAKGGKPVLVVQEGRATDVGKNLTGRWYSGSLEKIAREQKVDLVNIFQIALANFNKIGQEKTNALFQPDGLHLTQGGANYIAQTLVDNYKELK